MGGHWPWEARELNPQEPFSETTIPSHRESIWLLKTSVIRIAVSPIQKASSPPRQEI
jgi:hypothetical protein